MEEGGIDPVESIAGARAPAAAAPGLETAGARSFLRGFTALFVLALVALCAASVVLDPSGVFGIRVVPASQQTTRDDKARALLALAEKPETLVLGSSRVWSIRPSRILELTGSRAFNFGVDNGTIADFEASYRFAREQCGAPIKRLLIGLDVEILNERHGGRLEYSRLLRPFAAPGAVPSFARMLPEYLLGSEIIDSDVRSIENLVTGKVSVGNRTVALPKNAFKADGSATWPRYDDARRAGTFDLDRQIRDSIAKFQPQYVDFHGLSERRIAELRRLLVRAKADGVAVDVFVPPVHPRGMRSFPNLVARALETERLLAGLEAEGLLRFRRARLADFGGDPGEYYDINHTTSINGDKMLEHIYGAGASTPPPSNVP